MVKNVHSSPQSTLVIKEYIVYPNSAWRITFSVLRQKENACMDKFTVFVRVIPSQ